MVVFINPFTGTETLVADERKDEYLGAGFMLAPGFSSVKPIEQPAEEKKVEAAKKTRTKKK